MSIFQTTEVQKVGVIVKKVLIDFEQVIDLLSQDISENVDMDTGERCYNWVTDMINELTHKHMGIIKNCVCGEVIIKYENE